MAPVVVPALSHPQRIAFSGFPPIGAFGGADLSTRSHVSANYLSYIQWFAFTLTFLIFSNIIRFAVFLLTIL